MNKCIFSGRLTGDPETRHFDGKNGGKGGSVTNFSLAVSRVFTAGGEKREETTFPRFKAFGGLGETIAKHFPKGKEIILEARYEEDRWEDKESGEKRSRPVFVAEGFEFTGDKATQHSKSES